MLHFVHLLDNECDGDNFILFFCYFFFYVFASVVLEEGGGVLLGGWLGLIKMNELSISWFFH